MNVFSCEQGRGRGGTKKKGKTKPSAPPRILLCCCDLFALMKCLTSHSCLKRHSKAQFRIVCGMCMAGKTSTVGTKGGGGRKPRLEGIGKQKPLRLRHVMAHGSGLVDNSKINDDVCAEREEDKEREGKTAAG